MEDAVTKIEHSALDRLGFYTVLYKLGLCKIKGMTPRVDKSVLIDKIELEELKGWKMTIKWRDS